MVEGTFIWATWKRISGMEGVHRSGYSGVQLSTATIIRQKLGYGLLTRTHTRTHIQWKSTLKLGGFMPGEIHGAYDRPKNNGEKRL